jgi:hypothetical protein
MHSGLSRLSVLSIRVNDELGEVEVLKVGIRIVPAAIRVEPYEIRIVGSDIGGLGWSVLQEIESDFYFDHAVALQVITPLSINSTGEEFAGRIE